MLSDKLGGRREVLSAPFIEILGHLISKLDEDERQAEREQQEYYLNFVAMLNSNPQNEKQNKQTQKFMKEIQPKPKKKTDNNTSSSEDIKNKYQWPEKTQRKIDAQKAKNKE